jgi:hypothetical protein
MKAAPEEFDALRKLLALKRHEQPPPGYFDQLPRAILARIEAGALEAESGFWEKLLNGITLRPAVAYSAVGIVCAGLVVGFGLVVNDDTSATMVHNPFAPPEASAQVFSEDIAPALSSQLASTNGHESSMQPVLPSQTPFFNPLRQAVPVSYSPGQ